MYETLFREEASEQWTPTTGTDPEDAGVGGAAIAEHESGATINAAVLDGGVEINMVQPVVCDGLWATPETHQELFPTEADARDYLLELCDLTDLGRAQIDAFAIVPHDGDLDSVDLDALGDDVPAVDDLSLADVFAVTPTLLPAGLDLDYLIEHRRPIIELVYGFRTDPPDVLAEIADPESADASAELNVYTVARPDALALASDRPMESRR